jgi:hypothetical protein
MVRLGTAVLAGTVGHAVLMTDQPVDA